jgi:hypothetical protein
MSPIEELLIQILLTIEKGCKSHYYYKGKNAPKLDCEGCNDVWHAMQTWRAFKLVNNL